MGIILLIDVKGVESEYNIINNVSEYTFILWIENKQTNN